MSRRFLVDEQLPPALAEKLTAAGFASEHARTIGLGGGSDMSLWRHAARMGAAIITKDEEFAALTNSRSDGPAIVWLRIGNASSAALWRALEPLLPAVIEALENGERLIEIDQASG